MNSSLPTSVSTRSFACLNVATFINAFNDNALKVVTCLLTLEWMKDPAISARWIAFAGASFVVPYLLFSMLAGSMADRYRKNRLFILMQWLAVPILLMGILGLKNNSIAVLVFVLFLMGTQSALFSPAKYGLLPELFASTRLAWANGVVESVIFSGILLGTLAGSFSVDLLRGHLYGIGIYLLFFAALGAAVSSGVEKTARACPNKKLRLNPIADAWNEWKILRPNKLLSRVTLAIGFFWYIGALVQLNVLGYARDVVGTGPKGTGVMLTAMTVGIGMGSYAGGTAAGRNIRLTSVRVSVVGIALLLIALSGVGGSFAAVLACLFVLGFFGGGYIVPLNAVIQARSPADEKGRVIATTNFFAFSGILLASGVLWLLGSVWALSPAWIFLIAGISALVAAVLLWWLLPAYGGDSPVEKSCGRAGAAPLK